VAAAVLATATDRAGARWRVMTRIRRMQVPQQVVLVVSVLVRRQQQRHRCARCAMC